MFQLPELEFDEDALQPHMSAQTLRFHHGKHHRGYVETLNGLIAGTPYETMSLEKIIQTAAARDDQASRKIFNNAGQHWNHSFFWRCLDPQGGGEPGGAVAQLLNNNFGSFDAFRDSFIAEGKAHFGSGWLWLVLNSGRCEIVSTHDADNPLVHNQQPLLVCDLWEHAYYLDYQNDRGAFLASFIDGLVQWRFVDENLARA